MSAEEEKEQPGQEIGAEPAPEEPGIIADPMAGADAAAEAEAEARETGAEKKEKRFWPAALALMLLVLAGGGYYALTGLDDTAHKLGGGSDYDRLSANSDVYDGTAGRGAKNSDFFPLDEEGARQAAYKAEGDAKLDRMNPAVIRGKGQLAAEASVSAGSPDIPQPLEDVHESKGVPREEPQEGGMAEKLKGKAYFAAGPGGKRSKGQSVGGNTAAFEGTGALAGRASLQRETSQAKPRQAGKGGVMDSLKGAFRATFYGARLSSQDSARSWVSRAFDATPEAGTAIEYDEKMRSKLDRVNPDSIPSFLRDQDVNSAEAKRLATSEPGKPKLDKEGTYEALQKDKGYQQQKLASDFGNSMLNGMFAGISGTGGGNQPDPEVFSDPEDQNDFNSLGLGEYLESQGNGEECGCSAGSPCCCLPQDYFASQQDQGGTNCPTYGPFLPNDPCGAAIYGGDAGLGGAVVTP
ncbi:MAG: hypothetical protein A2X32_11855 [Elusimicrobia bacterium GWC2_64_44]|nr:MAG: hypothetical protein A2X32_11855 [Elusimicrobia bacterium GWC2_64_44]